MKRIRKDIEISNLLYKSLRGETSRDEEKLLEAWCLESRNRELFMELREEDHLYEGVADMCDVDTEIPFKRVNDRIRNKKRLRVMKYISGMAAAVFAGVVLTLLVTGKDEPAGITRFSPVPKGYMEPFAMLVTTSGNVVYPEDSVKQLALNAGGRDVVLPGDEKNIDESRPGKVQEVEYNVLTTSKRGNIKVTLYDGSQVWLNAGSELRYPNSFVENKRVVYLKGEAFFEVAKDAVHPFIVNTTSAEINVLGTSFNVRAREASCVTTLVEGRVMMKNGRRDSVELRRGQQAFIAEDGTIGVWEVDTRYYTGWMNNLFAFREVPLSEIMKVLEEWYGCECRFEKPELRDISYTTMVKRYSDVDSVLNVLAGTGDFRFVRINDLIVIKEK